MRNLVRVMLVGGAIALAAVQARAVPPAYELAVDGLACPFCAYGIEKKLMSIAGVAALKVDIAKGIVRVTMKDGATLGEAAARKAVEAAGFTLRRFGRVETE